MKLYATTTSERASKGQGGNTFLNTSYTIEQNGEVVEVVKIEGERYGGRYKIKISLPKHTSHIQLLETNEDDNLYSLETLVNYGRGRIEKLKGNKQKDECKHDWHSAWSGSEHVKICYKCDATMDSDGGIIQ